MLSQADEAQAAESSHYSFPQAFCCNCGALDCAKVLQHSRVTRNFSWGARETTFELPVPVCAACKRTTRRHPAGFLVRLGVLVLAFAAVYLLLFLLAQAILLPLWAGERLFTLSAVLAALLVLGFYLLRRPRPPQTSFYQPVRICEVKVQVPDVPSARADVVYMKLAFTNPDYLNVFANANRDSIQSGFLKAVKV
jgi:hypothetical protein